jgi:hypothetical protein
MTNAWKLAVYDKNHLIPLSFLSIIIAHIKTIM